MTKKCSACLKAKPLDEFNKSSARKHLDGRQGYCKVCSREKALARYKADPDKLNNRSRIWQAANPEKVKEHYQTERWKNQHRDVDQKRRAIKYNTESDNINRMIVWARDEGICGICNKSADVTNWHLDHIKSLCKGGTHTYGNVRVSHPSCNLSRKRD
jgi:5-methylcytosine-specific restriction endonuclease McrA